jgi:hypothetical protein
VCVCVFFLVVVVAVGKRCEVGKNEFVLFISLVIDV